MFAFLKQLFRRSALPRFPKLQERRRAIFRYWDGQAYRGRDPIAVMMEIEADPEYRPDTHPKLVDEGDAEATQIMARMVCRVFHVSALDPVTGQGYTITELLALWSTFGDFCEELKKNSSPWLMPPSPMGPTSSSSSEPITEPSAVST